MKNQSQWIRPTPPWYIQFVSSDGRGTRRLEYPSRAKAAQNIPTDALNISRDQKNRTYRVPVASK